MNYKTFDEDYRDFVEEVKHRNRSFLSKKSLAFLTWLKAVAKKHEITLTRGEPLFRARKSEVKDVLIPKAGMKPVNNLGSSGRANALNIPVLYLADRPEIAISEIRPETGDHVTVAVMEIKRNLKIIDFSVNKMEDPMTCQLFDEPQDSITKEIGCLFSIGNDFSKPLSKNDKEIDYIPTQVIADYFKRQGYHGIAYQSQYRSEEYPHVGKNYALFNLNHAHVKSDSMELYEVNEVIVKSRKADPAKRLMDRINAVEDGYN